MNTTIVIEKQLIKIHIWDLEVKNNKIIVNVDMPDAVFKAWKDYAEGR